MDGTKVVGKTIGEVEKFTGIPKRELKYYIEQRIMQPSQRSETGYWLYTDEDIQKAQLVSLCRELDFPVRAIRAILANPASCWPKELEMQIGRLTDKMGRTEAQIHLAKHLQYSGVWEALQIYCDNLAEESSALAAE